MSDGLDDFQENANVIGQASLTNAELFFNRAQGGFDQFVDINLLGQPITYQVNRKTAARNSNATPSNVGSTPQRSRNAFDVTVTAPAIGVWRAGTRFSATPTSWGVSTVTTEPPPKKSKNAT